MAHCLQSGSSQVRRGLGPKGDGTAVYWVLSGCDTWAASQQSCKKSGGDLAVFPTVDDRAFLHTRFVSGFNLGNSQGPQHDPAKHPGFPTRKSNGYYPCGTIKEKTGRYGDSRFNFAVWVGLSRVKKNVDDWQWNDGTPQPNEGFPWNYWSTYRLNEQLVDLGDCGLAAEAVAAIQKANPSSRGPGGYYFKGFRKAACELKFRAVCMKNKKRPSPSSKPPLPQPYNSFLEPKMHTPEECYTVANSYSMQRLSPPVNIKSCSVRRNIGSDGRTTAVYWLLPDCYTQKEAQEVCKKGSGHLAVFPTVDDRAFLHSRYVSGFNMGTAKGVESNPSVNQGKILAPHARPSLNEHNGYYKCGQLLKGMYEWWQSQGAGHFEGNKGHSRLNFAVWVGLDTTDGDNWSWFDGTRVRKDFPWNQWSTHYLDAQIVGDGKCGLAAEAVAAFTPGPGGYYMKGFRRADCNQKFQAVCMRVYSNAYGLLHPNPQPRMALGGVADPGRECHSIIGNDVKYCAVRRNFGPKGTAKAVYWLLSTCRNWEASRHECRKNHGDLAVFANADDRAYLHKRWVTGFNMGYAIGPQSGTSRGYYSCGTMKTAIAAAHEKKQNLAKGTGSPDSRFNFAVWTGLQRPNIDSEDWAWVDGTKVASAFPWNFRSTFWIDTQLVADGNCGLAGESVAVFSAGPAGYYMKGFRKADCNAEFQAVCMKCLVADCGV